MAARLGVADRLAGGPQRAEELAAASGVHAPSLRRLLRHLASLEILREEEDGRFALTLLGDTLRRDSPFSLRAAAILYGAPFVWRAIGDLHYAVATGKDTFTHAHGVPFFDHLAAHPDDAAAFRAWMTRSSQMQLADVLAAYDFSAFSTLVDVGGGQGALLAGILAACPRLRGVLFDSPEIVHRATFSEAVATRCQRIGGSFFDAVPPGGDAYLLQHVLHDWNDDRALRVLRNCRRACAREATLLIIEALVAEDDAPALSGFLDLLMMSLTGGRERSAAELARLLEAAGFRLTRCIPIGSPFSLLEAVPAEDPDPSP